MTESIQKKLLRVRPPRVRITYDVETGGAIEKKELPFIVGILADLSGNREKPDEFPLLKTRKMVDIDRDNFNDVMKTIGPRVDLVPVVHGIDDLKDSHDLKDKAITFRKLEDFEPMNVIGALPALSAKYHARGQIRGLQAKAESDDTVVNQLDVWIEDIDPTRLDARQKELMKAFSGEPVTDKPVQHQALVSLQAALATPDPSAALQKWSLLAAGDTAGVPKAKANANLLINAVSAEDSVENRVKAKDLLQLLMSDTPATPTDDDKLRLAARDAAVAKLGYADAAAAKSAVQPVATAMEKADDAGKIATATALLLLGCVAADDTTDVNASLYTDARELAETQLLAESRGVTLAFAKYLQAENGGKAPETAKLVFPLLQLLSGEGNGKAAAKAILSLRFFASQVVSGLQSENKALLKAIKKGAIAVIDEQVTQIDDELSKALSAIMHSEHFKAMEQTWRGLSYLVSRTETSTMLKLRVFDATKEELRKDMEKAVEFDQSTLFKLVYEAEYGTYGGFPYSLLIGGYEIDGGNDDIAFLKKISEVAASAHAPFIAAASAKLFGLSSFDKLDKPRDLKKIFESAELTSWREFRDMEDARYITLVLPRFLLRLPYGRPEKRNTIQCEGLNFEEHVSDPDSSSTLDANGNFVSHPPADNVNFLWGNAAYVLAERITNAFSLYNWTAAIRGVEGGGLVEDLPLYTYTSDAGTTELFCPTEVSITDRREKELNDLGFISLCHCKGAGKAAFFGGQTTNLPKKYFSDEANANARISAMLPYMLAASRFAHYIKVIMREKIGSFMTRGNVESFLNGWIANYVLLDDNATQEVKAAYPLRAANIVVTDVPGEPGVYRATAFLKPHFQLEELTTSIRLVANLPK